jgi:hypothetical protein
MTMHVGQATGPRLAAQRFSRRLAGLLGGGVALVAALPAPPAQASEGGASFYLLGSGGPEAAVLPPIPGVFLGNTAFYYHGSAGADREFVIGGNVVAGLRATIAADFPTVLWVPTTNLGGATLAFGLIVPFGEPSVDVSALLTGPRGRTFGVSRGDSYFVFGDPALLGEAGWKFGKTSIAVSTLLNIPMGDYRAGQLANLAFHRWAGDLSLAATWHDPQSGWDVSGKFGFTFNGTNQFNDYTTGTESHYEASIEKAFSPKFSAGFQAYYFYQLTGDSGAGAKLGAFEGRVLGIGGQAAYNFKIAGKIPATLRLHGTTEFDATNRLEGHTIWLDFSMPLYVRLPPGAAPP